MVCLQCQLVPLPNPAGHAGLGIGKHALVRLAINTDEGNRQSRQTDRVGKPTLSEPSLDESTWYRDRLHKTDTSTERPLRYRKQII